MVCLFVFLFDKRTNARIQTLLRYPVKKIRLNFSVEATDRRHHFLNEKTGASASLRRLLETDLCACCSGFSPSTSFPGRTFMTTPVNKLRTLSFKLYNFYISEQLLSILARKTKDVSERLLENI